MRILLITDFYPPQVGGVEQHVRRLGQELAARGHVVDVATVAVPAAPASVDLASGEAAPGADGMRRADPGSPGPAARVERDGVVRVHRLRASLSRLPGAHREAGRPFTPPAPDPELVLGLARLVRRTRPQIVHAHAWSAYSYLPLHAVTNVPLIVTLHEYGLVCAKKSLVYCDEGPCSGPGLRKCVDCASAHYGAPRGVPIAIAELAFGPLLRASADRFIAVSDAVAAGNRLGDAACEIVPNWLPDRADAEEDGTSDHPAGTSSRLDLLPSEPFLLFVGALGRHKGFHVLLEAYAGLSAAPPLVCIGHRWADTPNVLPPGVTVLEDWPADAVMAAWRRAMLGVIPSTWAEPFGIVALEAMDAGRAVVASATGGLASLVRDGETGLLVPPGDAVALRAAIARLSQDAALRDRLAAGAAAEAASYRASSVVPRIEAIYRDAVRARATGRGRRGART